MKNNTPNSPEQFKQHFDNELLSDKYSEITTTKHWQKQETPLPEMNYDPDLNWLDKLLRTFGEMMEGFIPLLSALVKGLLVLALLWFFYWLFQKRGEIGNWVGERLPNKTSKTSQHTRQKYKESPLADDDELTSQIKQAIFDKHYVLALSLLYRSSLRAMAIDHELPIKKSDTELACQRLLASAKRTHQGELPYFNRLVLLWQTSAYGERLPADVDSQLASLFADWQRIYRQQGVSND